MSAPTLLPPPCILHEDPHLLVVNKPAGLNTHAPAPFAGEGLYDWLRQREARWAQLAILHRLDKETSGVLVFGKTGLANRSLTEQFTRRTLLKKYLLLIDREGPPAQLSARSQLRRVGDHYVSGPTGEAAETIFCPTPGSLPNPRLTFLEARPLTGRTHQIRVHAADHGFPILGDTRYGGSPFPRLCLHAAEISLLHPQTGQTVTFSAPVDFQADPGLALRGALIEGRETDAFHLRHGQSDGWPGWYIDRLGDFLLSQSQEALSELQAAELSRLARDLGVRGAYHKRLQRHLRTTDRQEASPQPVLGEMAPPRFSIRENGLCYELSFTEGYSVGLFLDQRENRRRFLTGHVAAGFPLLLKGNRQPETLNTFAYTCGFSVCAARAGARVTSLDLSKKYLDWGRQNFRLNGLDPAGHDFIFGDAFEWLHRLAKKARRFEVIVLDPPTFSQSKAHGVFRAQKDWGQLLDATLPLLAPSGVLLASGNATDWAPEDFLAGAQQAVARASRTLLQHHYVPQPADFPISRAEPAYLKTVWLRVT